MMSSIEKKKLYRIQVEVMPEAHRYGVLGAGVGAHYLWFVFVDCVYRTGILRS